uniref:Uncharacterized protein n=1 Tax=Oryza nivara TaxID=4536 RepID=A0A679BDF1_ORYNI|nr:hypothetical protein [Oryza sativa f. spontanea]
MTGGPHPSARVAGGPARQRRACGEEADGPRGREERGRELGRAGPRREGGKRTSFRDVTNPPPLQESRPRDSRRLA